ncbi:MAG TPA: hypothetical protein VIM77_09440 [Mucilaginibacter sp.]
MKYFTLIIMAVSLCGTGACNKNGLTDPSSSEIAGRWRWVKSVGGIGGFTLTPASEGFNQTQVFNADSTFKMYRNDSLTAQKQYSVTRNYKYNGQVYDLLKIGDFTGSAFIIRNDTLYTQDIFIADGFDNVYVRIK